jgi:hypothetical protein
MVSRTTPTMNVVRERKWLRASAIASPAMSA